ncbi:hypothetical protein PPS11_04870 [Pseudomonas putida S11]|nr:hypothetical protein PPS11_04870 [Pseudomonas putida S11]
MGTKGGYHGQLDHVCALLAHYRQGVALYRVQLGGHLAAVGKAGFGQLHAAARAAEQFHIEEGFQAAYLSTDGTLGQGEFLGGLGKALVARRRLEANQSGGTGDLAAHVRQPHS